MIGLGSDGQVIASHLLYVLVITVLATRIMRGFADREVMIRAQEAGLSAAICIGILGLTLERIYYIAARILRPYDVDLWQMHPAPQVLAGITAMGLMIAGVPFVLARIDEQAAAWRRIGLEALGIIVLWFLLRAVLA